MHIFKQKGFVWLVVFVVLIGGFTLYYFHKKNIDLLKQTAIKWANSDADLTSRQKRIEGISLMTNSELKTLVKIINEYFNTNSSLPTDLQKFWDYASNKYGIGG